MAIFSPTLAPDLPVALKHPLVYKWTKTVQAIRENLPFTPHPVGLCVSCSGVFASWAVISKSSLFNLESD